MTDRRALILFGLSVIGATFSLRGANGPKQAAPKQSFEETKTERMNFLPDGIIRIDNSYGYLTVEGWDEPEVEIIVTKTTNRFYEPEQKTKAEQHFPEVEVIAERRSDKELMISTSLPMRHNFIGSILPSKRIIVTMPKHSRRGITVEYTVHAPRDSRLVIHHDNGYVWVSDITGDIQAYSHTGDMIVMLPDPGPYSIDARTRLGSVSSDFASKANRSFFLGSRSVHAAEASSHSVHLRMGRGSITIKQSAVRAFLEKLKGRLTFSARCPIAIGSGRRQPGSIVLRWVLSIRRVYFRMRGWAHIPVKPAGAPV